MPIRKELREFYSGPAWREIRARILTRARHRCEFCHAPDRLVVERGPGGVWRLAGTNSLWRDVSGNFTTSDPLPERRRRVKIILTVAHLNHTPGDDREDNLAALCQYCHLRYDLEHHRRTRQTRKDARRPLLALVS